MTSIKISHNTALPLRLANRHGLVTGSTGSGKTTTAASLIEQFSAAGVPVFASDVKGDLAGLSRSAPFASLICSANMASLSGHQFKKSARYSSVPYYR
jgi:hypothetical protein